MENTSFLYLSKFFYYDLLDGSSVFIFFLSFITPFHLLLHNEFNLHGRIALFIITLPLYSRRAHNVGGQKICVMNAKMFAWKSWCRKFAAQAT